MHITMNHVYTYYGWEGLFNPLDMHGYLEAPYAEYQRCHKDASSAESMDLLKKFFSAIENTNPDRDPDYLLPAVGPPILNRIDRRLTGIKIENTGEQPYCSKNRQR